MIEELLYTSAPKGLKPGSQGFCTVCSTVGMAQTTAERLEALSGYRHAFPLTDPRATLNPVNCSHLTLRLAGRPTHVLSRIANAGHDYSGRSNKLAHHLAFEQTANWPAGPARMLQAPSVMVTAWDGNLRTFAPRTLNLPPLPTQIQLSAWKQLSGDHGWAGWVAEQLLQQPLPIHVIFAPGTPTLDLVREVLDLLPPARRWDVTFSTYFTRLPAGVDCRLRFVLDETPEATSLRHDARAQVLDLTKPLPPAHGGQLVATARTGTILQPATTAAQQPLGSSDPTTLTKAPPPIPPALNSLSSTAPAERPQTLVPGLSDQPFSFSLQGSSPRRPRKVTAATRYLTTALALLLMLTAAYFAGTTNLLSGRPPATTPPPLTAATPVSPATASPKPVATDSNPNHTSKPAVTPVVAGPPLDSSPTAPPSVAEPPTATVPPPKTATTSVIAPADQPADQPIDKAIEKPATKPATKTNPFGLITTILATNPETTVLWDWHDPGNRLVSDPLPLQLSTPESHLQITPWAPYNSHAATSPATNTFQISIQPQAEQHGIWDVQATNGTTHVSVGQIHLKPADPATLAAATHQLEFHWKPQQDQSIASLVRWCPLELQADGGSVCCALRPPETLPPSSLAKFLSSGYAEAIALSHPMFQPLIPEDLSTLRLGIELHRDGVPAAPWEVLSAAEPLRILLDPDGQLTNIATPADAVPPDSPPVVSVSVRLLPPVRSQGAVGPPRGEAEINAQIPRIGLAAAKSRRGSTQTELFAELLNRKSGQLISAETLQQAIAQIEQCPDEVRLTLTDDQTSADLSRRLTNVGSRFQDANDVCSELLDKRLPALNKDLEARKQSLQQQLSDLASSKKSSAVEDMRQSQLENDIAQIDSALTANAALLTAVSAQQTWFNTTREPHLQALTRQLTGLRTTPLRLVFFIDFPDPAAPPESGRGRVRLMQVQLVDSTEATP
ncbi:MAG: hypothetical protein ACKOEO_13430 [Planctomycetaceae bacterium]